MIPTMVSRLTFCVLLLALTVTGCGPQETQERYTPASDRARSAVEAAMLAWLNGRPPGALEGNEPHTTVVDTHRRPEQTLEEYEVLGEVPSEAYRCFAVRVTYSNPEAEERIRYCVIGIDPLWVFRQEDYDMIAHWDHKMDPPDDVKSGEEVKPNATGEPTESESVDTSLPDSAE
jgi:hypothetical protein